MQLKQELAECFLSRFHLKERDRGVAGWVLASVVLKRTCWVQVWVQFTTCQNWKCDSNIKHSICTRIESHQK